MGATESFVERTWNAAHSASWFPGWITFQLAAVVLGALLVLRAGGRRLVAPYAVGVLLALAGAVLLGSGAEWLTWLVHGARGRPPQLEIAGFGAIGGLVTGHLLVAHARRVSAERALDVLAPAIGAMITVARIGCFFAGCDFGKPTTVPWALRYPAMTPAFRAQLDAGLLQAGAGHTLAVHPTQLYEAALGVLVVVAARALRHPRREGDRFALVVLVYAAGRIGIDVFRGDLAHGGSLGLTTTQGLALALTGLVVAWRARSWALRVEREGRPTTP